MIWQSSGGGSLVVRRLISERRRGLPISLQSASELFPFWAIIALLFAMAHWTRELDLALVSLIRKYWRDERWTAGSGRYIDWGVVFDLGSWPNGFTRATLKERWQENYRKWVSVNDPMTP